MNTHDPIVGRYVYVQCEGKTYRTYYEEHGEGIPLVCLHTAGTDGRQYRHQLCDPDIAANFRVIAFDMPWHGKSLPPSDFYLKEDEYKLTAKFYSDFIVAFCHALELKKPVIMGQSMGGNVCLSLALRYEHEFLGSDRARGLRLLARLVDRSAASSAHPWRRSGGDLGLRSDVAGKSG